MPEDGPSAGTGLAGRLVSYAESDDREIQMTRRAFHVRARTMIRKIREWGSRTAVPATAALLAGLLALPVAGCGSDSTESTDTGAADVVDAGDVEEPEDTAEPTPDADSGEDAADGFTAPGILCEACSEDGDCGESDDRCLQLPDGNQVCTRFCNPSGESPCPQAFRCANLDDDETTGQCVPERLTCEQRCSGVECGGNRRCNPLNGECEAPLDFCDTGCQLDSMCGDGSEDQCLTLPGTEAPQESICTQTCNPESDDSECPVDSFCTAVAPEEDPTAGVCFPLGGTCVDRCTDQSCPEGQNCNVRTGECEGAQFSACQTGCSRNAQCGDQNDWCLDLGIGEGPNCWIGCGEGAEACPSNYECQQLAGTTLSLCLPESRSCSECTDVSCLPGGACNPQTGTCEVLDCRETGCPDGEACDPRSTSCVEIGRSCSGGSWAADCDNVVTGCTSRRPGTSGTCEAICSSDADCSSEESCIDTNLEKFCLEEDLGGPGTCGTLRRSGTEVGEGCSSSSDCGPSAPTCVRGGDIDGYCSRTCTSDTDCSGAQQCARGPSGQRVCTPVQCRCAATIGAGAAVRGALQSALQTLGFDLCDVRSNTEGALALQSLANTPLAAERLAGWLEFPIAGIRDAAGAADSAEPSTDAPGSILESAAEAAGISISAQAGSFPFSGSNSKLTQAAAELTRAAGGSPNISALEAEAQKVPSGFQDVAAPIVREVADAYRSRDQALQSAGWGATRRNEAFTGAHYLLLPGTAALVSQAPDLSQSGVAADYRAFPTRKMADAAADVAATISSAQSNASGRSGWTGFTYSVDTPAGKIVLGDAGDTVYDSSNSSFSGDIAVLIDAGGSDTYRISAGANTSVSNGVSVAVDLGGEDTYTYDKVGDPLDTQNLLPSDSAGRQNRSARGEGPISLSETSRQGAGRVGIGMLIDYGTSADEYESLRMSQGAAVFGVGLLYDAGGGDALRAEALSQGAALGGLGVVGSAAGNDSYEVWHAGQGFGAASGTGVLFDRGGDDTYTAVRGESNGGGVLYFSQVDTGSSNRNLAQGAGAGVASTSNSTGLGGGLGILRDASGGDTYEAGTYAQGFGTVRGVGVLSDSSGVDRYGARAYVQGAGRRFGGGLLDERAGDDTYNESVSSRQLGQGIGEAYGWGGFVEGGGADEITYGSPGGGFGLDGGFGIAANAGGSDTHDIGSQTGWGTATNTAMMGDPLDGVLTFGAFVDAGGASDTYLRPQISGSGIGDGATWLQPDPPTSAEKGVGVDQ